MTRRTVRIGVTGPIGCGKSTVAGWLRELGAVVVDADAVSREVMEPGEPALDAVVAAFGDTLLTADGRLDRAALGRLVFADPAALRRLEAIVHPAVRPRIEAAIRDARASGAPAVVVEAIKLVEGGLAALCDEVWLVTCDPAAQRDRVIARGADPADAEARIRAQGDLAMRLAPVATRIVDTTGSLGEVRVRVELAYAAALSTPRDHRAERMTVRRIERPAGPH
ncbi:MAG: dephospho-CoA kinase [Anaerolinea sp.]|nr:dephospho-CoA kinase [Anaerolinea sp.]